MLAPHMNVPSPVGVWIGVGGWGRTKGMVRAEVGI